MFWSKSSHQTASSELTGCKSYVSCCCCRFASRQRDSFPSGMIDSVYPGRSLSHASQSSAHLQRLPSHQRRLNPSPSTPRWCEKAHQLVQCVRCVVGTEHLGSQAGHEGLQVSVNLRRVQGVEQVVIVLLACTKTDEYIPVPSERLLKSAWLRSTAMLLA
jgi:hypothetical protein